MSRYRQTLTAAYALCTVAVLTACGGGSGDDKPVAPVSFTVTATAGSGGSISPASRNVQSGQTTTFTVTPDGGYSIADVTGCNGSLTGNTYTTAAVMANCSVVATFALQDYAELNAAVTSYMNKHNLPEGVIAVVNNERLVYLRHFGENSETPEPDKLFRIASVTKPLTMAAVLHLVDNGKLSLSDRIFGSSGVLQHKYGETTYKTNIENITVAHLLLHTSGWSDVPFDIMFSSPELGKAELIAHVLSERELVALPGVQYNYLNFGYMLLGEVIEVISGKSFIDYLNQDVFSSINSKALYIAGNTLADKRDDEVQYFDSEQLSPYQMDLARLDAAGGVLSNARTLANVLVRLDRKNGKPDVLTPGSLNFSYFGYTNWYHFGSLPGTSAFIGRIDDSYGYTAVFNARNIQDANQHQEFNDLISPLIKNQTWPATDLF